MSINILLTVLRGPALSSSHVHASEVQALRSTMCRGATLTPSALGSLVLLNLHCSIQALSARSSGQNLSLPSRKIKLKVQIHGYQIRCQMATVTNFGQLSTAERLTARHLDRSLPHLPSSHCNPQELPALEDTVIYKENTSIIWEIIPDPQGYSRYSQ